MRQSAIIGNQFYVEGSRIAVPDVRKNGGIKADWTDVEVLNPAGEVIEFDIDDAKKALDAAEWDNSTMDGGFWNC